jgi:cytochrome c
MRLPILAFLLAAATLSAAEPPPDYRFKVETLLEDIPQPMQIEAAPDGRIFFIEIGGKVKVFHPDTKQAVEAGRLEVTTALENGLLGMALDPQFARNGWIYLLHSPKSFEGQVISRFTMKGDIMDPASRKDLLSYPEQRKECCHHAGALRFGPDGCLYASSGDNTNPFKSDGFAPLDDRPDRNPWDSQKSSANTNDLRGKILRIKPKDDGTYEIPAGNLFPPGTPQTRPEIYAMGFRNPWRFTVDPKTGIVYVGDVGPDSGQARADRGPNGYDTVNQIRKPGYFGWPYSRGNEAYAAFNFDTLQPGAKFDPLKPLNLSANNTGAKELPPVQPPLLFYPFGAVKEYPLLGKGGRCACAGPVFRYDPKFAQTGGFPEYFDNCLLIYDWQRPFMTWVRLDRDAKMVGMEPFTSAVRLAQGSDDGSGRFQVKRPTDMFFGRDGALYLLDYGETWNINKDSRLIRISYQRGNLAPTAKIAVQTAAGREPLTVELSAEGSKDPEGEAMTYEWRLQPGDRVLAKTASLKAAIPTPGTYRAELRVTDAQGATNTASVPVTVGNTLPQVAFETPQDGDFFTPGQPIKFKVTVRDAEDGDSAAKADEMGVRTLVSAQWKTADGKAADIDPGLTLMKQSDCFNCHATEQPLVGPPLLKIAEKYRGQPGAENASAERVIKGSTGIWGQVGMLPHPQHTDDEVHFMVRWILSLEAGKGTPGMSRGLAGEVVPPKNRASGGILEAVYADVGRSPVGSLSGRAVVSLRTRRIEAEQADEIKGPQALGDDKAGGKKALGSIGDKHYLKLSTINLAGTASATLCAASAGSGGKIEIHAGAPNGELLGEVEVKPTGAWNTWVELSTPLKIPANPRGDLYVVFVKPGIGGGMMNFDWIQFNPP